MITYGAFYASKIQADENLISSSCFNSTLKESNSINLNNAIPLSNEEGLRSEAYTFTLSNTCKIRTFYNVIINTKNKNLQDNKIMISINGKSGKLLFSYTVNETYS